jgi:FSR family fosmidomycin resistance protein-like MFS transporter
LLPGRTGLASGVILGLGFVSVSIGVPITGALADRTSIPFALSCTAFLAVGAIALTLILPASVFNFARRSPPPALETAEATA